MLGESVGQLRHTGVVLELQLAGDAVKVRAQGDGVDAGDIELSTKNGNLSGTLAGKAEDYRLRCSVKKGDSNQPDVREGGSRSLVASVNNGDLSIRFAGD